MNFGAFWKKGQSKLVHWFKIARCRDCVIYRALLRSYNITGIGKMVNLQPCFVGLGLVVREWYWPIRWTTRSRFRIYFSIFCISRGFGGVVDGKYDVKRRNNKNKKNKKPAKKKSREI